MIKIHYELEANSPHIQTVKDFIQTCEEAYANREKELKKYETRGECYDILAESNGKGPILALGFRMNEQPDKWVIKQAHMKYTTFSGKADSTIRFYSPQGQTKDGRVERNHMRSLTLPDAQDFQAVMGFKDFWHFQNGCSVGTLGYTVIGHDTDSPRYILHVPVRGGKKKQFVPEGARELLSSEWAELKDRD